jgi:hypothetical protein
MSKRCPLYGSLDESEATAADLGLVREGDMDLKLTLTGLARGGRAGGGGGGGVTELKLDMKAVRLMKKRKQEEDSAYLQSKVKGTARRKSTSGPADELNAIVRDVLQTLLAFKVLAPPFQLPVKERNAPGYAALIARPICLNEMLKTARDGRYASSAQFRADLELLRANAHAYNRDGRGDAMVPNLADQLVSRAHDALAKQEHRLRLVEDQLAQDGADEMLE